MFANRSLMFLIFASILTGCGGSDNQSDFSQSDNPVHVATYVQALSDKVGSPAFAASFVEGSKPTREDEKKYINLQFEAAELPVVRSDSAKVKVKVTTEVLISRKKKSVSSPTESNKDRVFEWELVKTADGWKFKNAPVN
jgi:hypothetical protein